MRFENNESQLFGSLGDNMKTATWEVIETPKVKTNYQRFIEAVQSTSAVNPDFARGATLQKVLDQAVASDAQKALSLSV